jgi:Ni/Co efflux regulator RcnB
VRDYRVYGLSEPPYGCRWVRVNNDVVLAAIATGVVLDVAYNVF